MRLAYLGGAVDAVSLEQARGWRGEWGDALLEIGIGSYSPIHAWRSRPDLMTRAAMGRVCRVNRLALRECELFLLNADAGPMWGSLRELESAMQLGKEVHVVSAAPLVSYEAWDITNRHPSLASLIAELKARSVYPKLFKERV